MLWLLAAALLTSLVLGCTFVALHRLKDLRGEAVQPPGPPLTDEQSMTQVVGAARQFVTAGRLRNAGGTYLLVPCGVDDGPPYQGSAYVDFDLPSITETPAYLRRISAALSSRGWTEGMAPNQHPGGKILVKGRVSATLYRNPDVPRRGVLEIYGECRNVTDHRLDATGFVDISDRIGGGS